MNNYEKALEHYQSMNPALFDILDRFEVRQPHQADDEIHEVSVAIRLRPLENEEDDLRRLCLSFSGVRNLKVNFQGFMYISGMSIRLIRDAQWERLNYAVEDAENHTFSFVCKGFQASIENKGDLSDGLRQ